VDREVPAVPGTTHAVRWGLGDAAWIYPAGLAAAIFLATIGTLIEGTRVGEDPGALTTALNFVGQFGVWVGGLLFISHRKGRGSLRLDFGFVAHARHVWGLVAGIGLSVVLTLMVYPLVSLAHFEKQGVVDELKDSSGAKRAVFVVTAGFVAPVVEELFFRGLLLRALRRRWSPEVAIGAGAVIFALAHPLLDPHLGTFALVPALFALGAISGIAATWTGELSLSITLHVGFNLLTIVTLAVLHF
jgi:membrane protease YdiL (CAAX protease family)